MNFGTIIREYTILDYKVREVLYPGFGIATEQRSRVDGKWYHMKLDRDSARLCDAMIQLHA